MPCNCAKRDRGRFHEVGGMAMATMAGYPDGPGGTYPLASYADCADPWSGEDFGVLVAGRGDAAKERLFRQDDAEIAFEYARVVVASVIRVPSRSLCAAAVSALLAGDLGQQ